MFTLPAHGKKGQGSSEEGEEREGREGSEREEINRVKKEGRERGRKGGREEEEYIFPECFRSQVLLWAGRLRWSSKPRVAGAGRGKLPEEGRAP